MTPSSSAVSSSSADKALPTGLPGCDLVFGRDQAAAKHAGCHPRRNVEIGQRPVAPGRRRAGGGAFFCSCRGLRGQRWRLARLGRIASLLLCGGGG
ncbi:hypothetical protein VTK73DRAFT_427 [Phialemonium thermophilum]|uniref:Uncharacterized protein n=1 Tax=Phialemonium thermophilum TaxID=223376 RepID=A0ABR3VV75_9PEZI